MNANPVYHSPKLTNALGDEPVVQQEREVPSAIGRLHFALEQLSGAESALWKRLDPVLRPEPGSSPAEKKEPIVSCSLAGALDQMAQRILLIQHNLSSLENRIQL